MKFKGSFTAKLKVSAGDIKNTNEVKFKPVEVESGIFPDTGHYAKNLTAQELYSVLLYGTSDGRIPSRNVLDFLQHYVEGNTESFIGMYLEKQGQWQPAGHLIGQDINNYHKSLIYGFASPGNALSTIAKKGRDDPLVDTGELVKSIAYSVNGKGRYGKG